MTDAAKTAPQQRGRPFQKGKSGNPSGRPVGSRHKVSLLVEALIEKQAEALTARALQNALAGDGPLLKALLDRLAPPRKDAPVTFPLAEMRTAADAAHAAAGVLKAVALGELTPSEGAHVMALIETYRRTLETTELEARVAALEAGTA